MKTFWMHTDCLRASIPSAAVDTVFIFDPKQIEHEQWGLKRLVFLFECIPHGVRILKGDTVSLLSQFDEVVTEATPDPWIRECIEALHWNVTVVAPTPFAHLGATSESDLKRFSRYWKKVESKVLA